jgi:hypothetical protein
VSPRITLGEPGDLTGFPWTNPPSLLHRICLDARDTWWFSTDGSGRFDLAPPEGTCYFAADAAGAIREASRLGPVTPAWVAGRVRCEVPPPDPRARLAATTRKAAAAFGITNELTALIPYDVPRHWAAAFRAREFAGIRHALRHDSRARPGGVSLFGAAGKRSTPKGRRSRLTVDEVRTAGVRVIPPPHSAVLRIDRSPIARRTGR